MDSPLVVITGAGASVNLGRAGQRMPQMTGWATHLCQSLSAYSDVLGLRPNMAGDEFEAKIGDFLRCARSLANCLPFIRLGLPSPMTDSEELHARWFGQAEHACREIEKQLFSSLHELFSGDRIDPHAAGTAYGKLLSALDNPKRYSIATTNYDCSAELALRDMRVRTFSGVDAGFGERHLEPVHLGEELLEDTARHPVLYLHGRVGWYRDASGDLVAADVRAPFNGDYGSPALLLPDPNKVYDDSDTVKMWSLFERLMGQAQRVLVVGHSLHDRVLLQVLRLVSDQHLAVTVYAPEGAGRTQWDASAEELMARIGRRPHLIPMDFGPELAVDQRRLQAFAEGKAPEHNSSSIIARV